MTRISIIVPTHDGEGLARCLASIRPQLGPGDEVVIAFDTHGGGASVARAADDRIRCISYDAGYHAWGHPQRNMATMGATGDLLLHLDDDDALAPGALDAVRAAAIAHPGRPLMFRFVAPWRLPVWTRKVVAPGLVGGAGFVAPNDPARLGHWSDRYEGDYDYIAGTLALYPPDALIWREEVIVICRPDEPPTLAMWEAVDEEDAEIVRQIRNLGREQMTNDPREITPEQQAAWWAARDPEACRVWIAAMGQMAVGFGMLRLAHGRWWATLAVRPEFRGRGFGTDLYRHLLAECPGDLWIEVRADNMPSLNSARRAGFGDTIEGNLGVLRLVARKALAPA